MVFPRQLLVCDIYTEFWSKSWSIYRAFSVTWSAAKQKLLGIKESFNMSKEFNSHRIFFIHKHGRRFIVLYTNMAVVMSCENDVLNQSNIWPSKRTEKANSTQPVCGKFPVTWTLFQTCSSVVKRRMIKQCPIRSLSLPHFQILNKEARFHSPTP